MSEFLFRNLSVKVFPAEEAADREGCPDCSYVCVGDSQFACREPSVVCQLACSNVATPIGCNFDCSRVVSQPCGLNCSNLPTPGGCELDCSRVVSNPCGFTCTNNPTPDCACSSPRCTLAGDNPTILIADPGGRVGDARSQLAVLKDRMRRNLAAVEAAEQELEAAGRPKTVEEIDAVRSHLLAAVAELDEQKAEMEGRRSGPE